MKKRVLVRITEKIKLLGKNNDCNEFEIIQPLKNRKIIIKTINNLEPKNAINFYISQDLINSDSWEINDKDNKISYVNLSNKNPKNQEFESNKNKTSANKTLPNKLINENIERSSSDDYQLKQLQEQINQLNIKIATNEQEFNSQIISLKQEFDILLSQQETKKPRNFINTNSLNEWQGNRDWKIKNFILIYVWINPLRMKKLNSENVQTYEYEARIKTKFRTLKIETNHQFNKKLNMRFYVPKSYLELTYWEINDKENNIRI